MIEFSKDNEETLEKVMTGTMELCVDADRVSVPVDRYEELIRAETELDIILRGFRTNTGFQLDCILNAIFGPEPEPAPEPEKPGEDGGDA